MSDLINALIKVPDYRRAQGKRHPLTPEEQKHIETRLSSFPLDKLKPRAYLANC